MHFTPTSGSWLNLVEVFFGIITRQAIRRGTFTSVKDLIAAIETFIDAWNDRCQPFVWTKTADEILTKANRKVTQTRNTSVPKLNSTTEDPIISPSARLAPRGSQVPHECPAGENSCNRLSVIRPDPVLRYR